MHVVSGAPSHGTPPVTLVMLAIVCGVGKIAFAMRT